MTSIDLHTLDDTLERWSDRLNPVLVKETRQVLKSRGFVGAFMTMLTLAFLASLVLVAQAVTRLEHGEPGPTFFGVYLTVLMLALCFVVPMNVFRSVSAEFEHKTFESLAVTALSAQRIVWGKLQGAFVQMAAYYSAVAPFVCFTYLIGGIGWPAIVASLVITWLTSLTACLGGLMLGSLTRGGAGQVIATLVLLAGAFVVFMVGTMMATSVSTMGVGWDELASLVAGFACLCYAGLFYGMLTLGVAFNQFTPTMPDNTAPYATAYTRQLRQQHTERIIAAGQQPIAQDVVTS